MSSRRMFLYIALLPQNCFLDMFAVLLLISCFHEVMLEQDWPSLNIFFFTIVTMQWAIAFGRFWYPGGSGNSRAALLPWHVFLGIYIYALAVATATTGFLEKATFLQTNKVISRYSLEAILVNSLGILVVVMGGLVTLAIIAPISSRGDTHKGAAE